MCKFRDLTADEIECRVKKVTDKGAIVLLYKTARTDYSLLDETVSPERWTCDYEDIKGNLYCTISIYDPELGQWISKKNCGTESREDDEGNEKKGEASDAFKRAGFAWGIGRKLYTAPFIFIPANNMTIQSGKTYDTFSVSEIAYDEKKITRLVIVNDKRGGVAYTWTDKLSAGGAGRREPTHNTPPAPAPRTEDTRPPEAVSDICPWCKKRVMPAFSQKLNRELSGAEIIAAYGGMCQPCYNRSKAAAAASAQAAAEAEARAMAAP